MKTLAGKQSSTEIQALRQSLSLLPTVLADELPLTPLVPEWDGEVNLLSYSEFLKVIYGNAVTGDKLAASHISW